MFFPFDLHEPLELELDDGRVVKFLPSGKPRMWLGRARESGLWVDLHATGVRDPEKGPDAWTPVGALHRWDARSPSIRAKQIGAADAQQWRLANPFADLRARCLQAIDTLNMIITSFRGRYTGSASVAEVLTSARAVTLAGFSDHLPERPAKVETAEAGLQLVETIYNWCARQEAGAEKLPPVERIAAPLQAVDWSPEQTIQKWAKWFGVSSDTMSDRLKKQTIRNKELSRQSYMIDMNDLPAHVKERLQQAQGNGRA